jgi:4-hydroxy-2-oxoglutarate aldolase
LSKKIELKGVIPPVVTPFVDGEVSLEKYEENLNRWCEVGITGFLVLGSNGEAVHLTEEEKLALVEKTAATVPDDKPVIVGSGCLTTIETIELTNKAAAKGAQAALIITPFFYSDAMNRDALLAHYTEIADKADIPIMLYNVPKYTNVVIPPEVVVELSKHENIIGMKDSSGNIAYLSRIIDVTPDDFDVMVGTANAFLAGLVLGVRGGILALANTAPKECLQIYSLFKQGKLDEAKELQLKMVPVNQAVTARFGIAGLKAAMDMVGFYGGIPRKPLLPLKTEEKMELKAILQGAGLI